MAAVSDDGVRVVLVDDDPLVRAGLRMILGGDRAIEVVGEACDGIAAEDDPAPTPGPPSPANVTRSRACRRDGQPIGIAERGPLFVIYPMVDHPELPTQVYFNRTVWQVSRITLE